MCHGVDCPERPLGGREALRHPGQCRCEERGGGLSFESYDGADYESLTLDQARLPDVIVAYRMLGAPVTTEHGGPVRLYVGPMFGYKSLKWLSAIRVVDQVIPGFWEQNGYPVNGWRDGSTGPTDKSLT